MISINCFENIKRKHGGYGSWAIWPSAGEKPKSNMGDMTIFDNEKNPSLLELFNPEVIMVALNFSRPIEFTEPFLNFHDKSPWANDFKIRFAFRDTSYWGAYMTDVIKNLPEVNSKKVLGYLQQDPSLILDNIKILREEIRDLGVQRPIILAFGKDVYEILYKHLRSDEYSGLVKLTHYSHQIGKERYRESVMKQINQVL